MAGVRPIRIVIGTIGVLLGLFGVFRLVTQIDVSDLIFLLVWLVGALVLHDGVLSPIVAGVGVTLARLVPPRARRFLQPTLIVMLLITVIALPMIHRENSQPPSKAILRQDYTSNLALALGIVAAVMVLSYVARVVRDRNRPTVGRRPRPGPGQAEPDGDVE